MAELIDLGKIRFDFKGAYSSGTTYERNDVVLYNGSSYVYKNVESAAGNSPTDSAYWDKLAEGVNVANEYSGYILTNNGTVTQWTTNPSVTTVTTSGDITAGDDLISSDSILAGSGASTFYDSLTNPKAVVQTSATDYAQIAFRNTGNSADSSTDFIAYANNGTDDSGWIDMGITAANFSDPEFTITGGHDGYVFMEAPAGTSGDGNLVFATGSNGAQNKIIFAAGGLSSDNTQMVITPDQNIHIEIPTASTSPTTGALTVVGGVGIQGDVNIQGAISFGGSGTSVTTDNLAVEDATITVGSNNVTDVVDLGIVLEYGIPTTPSTKTITNKALTSNIATLTTGTAHGYSIGDIAVITGVDATFNGTYPIASVPTTTTFTYQKTAANVTSAAVSPAGSVTVSAKRRFGGMVRDASDGIIKVFEEATTKPSNTVNFSEAGLINGDFQTGALTASTISASGLVTFTGGSSFTGTTDVQEMREQVVDVTLASNVGTLNWTSGNIYYIATAPTGAMTFNVTNVPTTASRVMTINVFVTQGSTGYIPTTFQIDGSTQTLKWAGGSAPSGTNGAGKIDIFTFTMMRTSGGSWIVYGGAMNNF
jgi:hypothetical protein